MTSWQIAEATITGLVRDLIQYVKQKIDAAIKYFDDNAEEILEYKRKYFESAIRDAHAAGLIHAPDALAKSRTFFAYYEGLLTQAAWSRPALAVAPEPKLIVT